MTEPLDLEGVFNVNEKLNGAERLFEGEIKGPEGFAVFENTLYTGLRGGAVVKLVDDKLVPVADLSHPCGNYSNHNILFFFKLLNFKKYCINIRIKKKREKFYQTCFQMDFGMRRGVAVCWA